MKCSTCGHENPEGSAFCEECGVRFERPCPSCGNTCAAAAKFCRSCGVSLLIRSAESTEARKIVTVVFADLIGSTSLHERLDAESARRLMDRYYEALRTVVEDHGGTVVKLLGDGVLAVFGVPRVAEDDAIRAVRAAIAMVQGVRVLGVTVSGDPPSSPTPNTLSVRVGINTGEVVVSAANDDVVGDPVNVAARLQQEANAGDIVIGEATRRLVSELVTLAPLGMLALKGRAETVAAYRVVSLERPAGAAATAFVGRDDELRRITAVYDAAVATPAARLAVVLGSPGLGKSRLLDEFSRRLDDRATMVSARCDAAGGATFAPLAKGLRTLLRLEDGGAAARDAVVAVLSATEADRDRIADGIAALLAGTPASPEETFFIVRRFLAALAGGKPVVLAIDDFQWAEPLLFDLVEHLVQWGSGVRLLVLAGARPELRDTRSSLTAATGLVADVITLGGLDAGAATRLAANVIGAEALPAAVAGRVLATSEGNPLFLGELVRMLVNDGVLKKEGERWTTDVALADLEMPPTIHALLAARIERLRPEDRAVLERAAVIGRQFSRAAVAHLLPREIGDLDARLEALRRSELIEPDTTWFVGEPALRFHHGLTRDAAYRRLLKGTRAELHSRFADWLEGKVGEDARTPEASGGRVELDETIGWHLEQAHQHLRELGPIDAQGRVLGERAAHRLAAAGRRALARDDLTPAGSLLGRALDRLDAADPAGADLALDWCEALLAAGDVTAARKAVDDLERLIAALTPSEPRTPNPAPRLQAWHTCFAGQLAVLTDPQALRSTADTVATAAEQLAASGDAAGEAKAHLVHALALARLGKIGLCEAALDKALAAARHADDRRRANTVLANAPLAALWGPSPVTRASGRCLDVVRVLRITQGAPAVEAGALRCQAVLEALRGRTEAARRMIASARRMVEELGIIQQLLEADVFAGLIDLLEGDAVAAERALRGAYNGLREHGLGIDAARAAAFLGRALLALGRGAEAEALSRESEALAGDDLQAAITWRGVRAEALAARGMHAEAVDFARAAVDLAAATDALLLHADARLALSTALRAAGRSGEAEAEQSRAIELCEAKGATLLAERARRSTRVEQVDRESVVPAKRERDGHRRVQENAAAANTARLRAVIAARDVEALSSVIADDAEVTDHRLGTTYDREGSLRSWRALIRTQHGQFDQELLATLGDSLTLYRQSISGNEATSQTLDVGAWESDAIVLGEVDAQGRRWRSEIFASDRLGDGIIRLYERYADLLPDGPERARAAATARSIASFLGPLDIDRLVSAITTDAEFGDHRGIISVGSARGVDEFRDAVRTLFAAASDMINRVDDVLALLPDAALLCVTNCGTDRVSGGTFERPFMFLFLFGADGRMTRIEQFDIGQETEAMARFDGLRQGPLPPTLSPAGREETPIPPSLAGKKAIGRRVRPNAVTARAARLDAVMAARDAEALANLDSADIEVIDHPTGATYDRKGNLASRLALLRAQDLKFRHEPLATLGDSLGLLHLSISASGAAGAKFDVGPYERDLLVLADSDEHGRSRRSELFAADRLGDAVTRLYQRYAELLEDGPERRRAAATAHSAAALLGPPDRWPFAPEAEATDHRIVGFGSVRGRDAVLQAIRALLQLSESFVTNIDDVLDLRSDALLVRWTTSGTLRVSGGAFERNLLMLWIFGPDGLLTRWEQFDPDHDAEALARFDAVTGASTAPRIENAATRSFVQFNEAWKARDWGRITAVARSDFRYLDRRRMLQLELDGRQAFEFIRPLFDMATSRLEWHVLATRGDRLALSRFRFEGADHDRGLTETESLMVVDVDEYGRGAMVRFDPDDLDAAYAELDARYAVGEAAPYARALKNLHDSARAVATRDWDMLASLYAPDFVMEDHRPLGWVTRTRDTYIESVRTLLDLRSDTTQRTQHILALDDRRSLTVGGFWGREAEGAFEISAVIVTEYSPEGIRQQQDVYSLDQLEEAWARFSAIAASPDRNPVAAELRPDPLRIPPNAATQAMERLQAHAEAGEWNAVRALCAPSLVFDDRRRGMLMTGDLDHFVASSQYIRSHHAHSARTVLATAGDKLALERVQWTGAAGVPVFEIDLFRLTEVDAEGRIVARILFDPDDRRAVSLEMLDRFARSDAARVIPAEYFAVQRAVRTNDLGQIRAALAENVVFDDHRRTGMGRLEGREAYVAALAALFEQAPDVLIEPLYYVAVEKHGVLAVAHSFGTLAKGGGEFESVFVQLGLFPGGSATGELFEIEDFDVARALFAELAIGAST